MLLGIFPHARVFVQGVAGHGFTSPEYSVNFLAQGLSDPPSELVAGDNDKHDVQVGQNSKQSRGKNDCSRALI